MAGHWHSLAELMFCLMRMIDSDSGHDSITAPDDMMMTTLSTLSPLLHNFNSWTVVTVSPSSHLSWLVSITHSPSFIRLLVLPSCQSSLCNYLHWPRVKQGQLMRVSVILMAIKSISLSLSLSSDQMSHARSGEARY